MVAGVKITDLIIARAQLGRDASKGQYTVSGEPRGRLGLPRRRIVTDIVRERLQTFWSCTTLRPAGLANRFWCKKRDLAINSIPMRDPQFAILFWP
jgi:hypothetical protein